MPYRAAVVAYQFFKKAISEGDFITPMKVQKMVYFANGYHLAKYGTPLVIEKFEAWKFGPVIPSIYWDFKSFGGQPITASAFEEASFFFDLEDLDDEARDSINFTWRATKNLSAAALSNWTHLNNSPWFKTYKTGERNTPIDDNLIREYFAKFLNKKTEA